MVVIKGGGATYQVTSGKQVPWEEVPDGFKRALAEQEEIAACVSLRRQAEQCIQSRGFWDADCVERTESYHRCQSIELTSKLPPRRSDS
jgi:hypothetical protein